MMCECERCDGLGQVECPKCGGDAEQYECISTTKLSPYHPDFEELNELQKDAKRCERDMRRLIDLKPARADSYKQQLRAVLNVLNEEADRIVKRK